MKKKLRNISLTLVLLLFFSISIFGQFKTGYKSYNEQRITKKLPPLQSQFEYFKSGHFISSVSENMESEFLQMSLFVYLTACLIQKGSAESKKPIEQKNSDDLADEKREKEYSEVQTKKHPIAWRLYENSLTISLLILFVVFFFLHAYGSLEVINEDRMVEGKKIIELKDVFSESDFWFESFQNWQSEFFSIAIMGILSIFLRQKGSPQSKKIWDANWKTGSD